MKKLCFIATMMAFILNIGCNRSEPKKDLEAVSKMKESPVCKREYPGDSCKLSKRFETQNINISGIAFKDMEEDTTSSGVFEDKEYVVAAYYLSKEYAEGKTILRVSLYNKKKKDIISTEIDLRKPKDIIGFSANVNVKDNYIYLGLHHNPSSGTTIILDTALKYIADIYGGEAKIFKGKKIIYARSQVHWAPTHYVELALFDIKTKKDMTIYPMKPFQKIRQEYIDINTDIVTKQLGKDWTIKHNYYSSGELFDNDIRGDVYIDGNTNSITFLAVFYRSGRYPPEIKLEEKEVVYVYRNIDNEKIEYKEMLFDDVKKKYGEAPLKDLLNEKNLKEIFSSK